MLFYESGGGDALIDASRYPSWVAGFLEKEADLLERISSKVQLLLEVGCMQGRYLEWAVGRNKSYVGIDRVSRYIDRGRRRLEALQASGLHFLEVWPAEQIHELGKLELGPKIFEESTLAFFPFNSLGNAEGPSAIVRSLALSGLSFYISTYTTSEAANDYRRRYYVSCGCQGVSMVENDHGVCFSSEDGLRSFSYHPEFLLTLMRRQGLKVELVEHSEVGAAYLSEDLVSAL